MEIRSGMDEWLGGSDAMPVSQKMPLKTAKKKGAGDGTKRDSTLEKTTETASSGHLMPVAEQSAPGTKVKARGKLELKAMLPMPFRSDATNCFALPMVRTTPQPPTVLDTMPAWMAAGQMNASPTRSHRKPNNQKETPHEKTPGRPKTQAPRPRRITRANVRSHRPSQP